MRLVALQTVGVRPAGAAETAYLPPGAAFDAPKAVAEALIAAGVARPAGTASKEKP